MNDLPAPGSQEDARLAARLVVEGLIEEQTARLVLEKVKDLLSRGRPLSAGEICVRKGWVSRTEACYLASPEAPPRDLLPGFELGAMLGQGGMSRVFAARAGAERRPVALKILHPRLRREAKSVGEFQAEAELLIALDHENLVKGEALSEVDQLVFLVMEQVQGRSVQEHLDGHGRFPEEAALYIILQAARALSALHARGLVHRDVKPANILVDDENRVKLCDLGLVIQAGGEGGDVTAGTASYVAPEQAEGRAGLDVRSDIYALGVTLYQLVVGSLPFEGETNEETMAKRLLKELHSPALKGLGISPIVHFFIQKMMALDPAVRYQDPEGLIADIEERIEGAKSLAAQPGRKDDGKKAPTALPFQKARYDLSRVNKPKKPPPGRRR